MNDPVVIGIICGLAGVVLGVLAMWALRASEQRHAIHYEVDEPSIPTGAAEVLAVVGRAYAVVDAVDGVVRANPSAYAFGLVRGHRLAQHKLIELTKRVRADGAIIDQRFELPRGPLGEGAWMVQLRVAPLSDEYILLLAEDRSQVSRTEAIRHDFVANVSHELKTPVGAIRLLAEAIDDAADDPLAVRRFADRLSVESMRLGALVQDIIELSRLQGKDHVDTAEPVRIPGLVREAMDRVRTEAERKNITLKTAQMADAMVFGDADQLMTAIRNLIDNAVSYSPDDTTVGIGVKIAKGLVQISVTDQGPGIDVDEQERIFERFYRVDSARSRGTGGTGLGLSIVKHVIANHGGEVSVWSRVGHGSTFTIRLPLVDPDTVDIIDKDDTKTTTDHGGKGERP